MSEPKRHVNSVHLAVVLLAGVAAVFVITLVLALVLPRRTVPTSDSTAEITAEPTDTPEETKAPSYDGGGEEISADEKNVIASLIQTDLSQQDSEAENMTVNASDIIFTGDSETVQADGTCTYRKNGKQYSQTFTYTWKSDENGSYEKSGSSLGQAVAENGSSSSAGKHSSSDKKTAEPTDLAEKGSYDITVGSGIQISASASSGETRMDVTDSEGSTQTIYDNSGSFSDDVTVTLTPGAYTLKVYSDATGGTWSFAAQ